ncbi:MAG: hypothetical protein U1E14_19120 [Geminicoccaceae bacterium]
MATVRHHGAAVLGDGDLQPQRAGAVREALGDKARAAVTCIVAILLGAQFVSGIIGTGRWGWPIVPYFLYAPPHHEGDRLALELSAFAVTGDGEALRIDRYNFGAPYPVFLNRVVYPIMNGNHADLKPLIGLYCGRTQDRLVAIRLEDNGVAIGRHGPVYGLDPVVFGEVAVDCATGAVR